MTKKNYTGYVVALLIAWAIIWEGWTLVNAVPNDTISETVWAAISDRPFIPFLTGFLMGHFFWQKKGR